MTTTDRSTDNQCSTPIDSRSAWRRFVDGFFPTWGMPIPEDDLPGFAPSYIKTVVECRLDWKDRLRVLVSGKCRVTTRLHTDVWVRKHQAESLFEVLPP